MLIRLNGSGNGLNDVVSEIQHIILNNILGSVNFDYSNGIYMWKILLQKL